MWNPSTFVDPVTKIREMIKSELYISQAAGSSLPAGWFSRQVRQACRLFATTEVFRHNLRSPGSPQFTPCETFPIE
jgi:hypothetical protein